MTIKLRVTDPKIPDDYRSPKVHTIRFEDRDKDDVIIAKVAQALSNRGYTINVKPSLLDAPSNSQNIMADITANSPDLQQRAKEVDEQMRAERTQRQLQKRETILQAEKERLLAVPEYELKRRESFDREADGSEGMGIALQRAQLAMQRAIFELLLVMHTDTDKKDN